MYFHYNRGGGNAHSVVIDGYRRDADRFMVHIVYGDGGDQRSHWYDLDKGIDTEDGSVERIRLFETIHPR